MYTKTLYGKEARDAIIIGLNKTADAVCSTLGPKGKTVLIQQEEGKPPILTKDGVSVCKAINFKDPIERFGSNLLQAAADQTNSVAGDGTTTATCLTQAMVLEADKCLSIEGNDPKLLKEGFEFAVQNILQNLKNQAQEVQTIEQIKHIATISANGDQQLGHLISQAMEKVSADGIITVEDAKGMNTSVEFVEGLRFDKGYLSPYFINNQERMCVEYEDVFVLVTDKKIAELNDLIPVLEYIQRSQQKLLIIADDVEGAALQGLVLNKTKANLQVVAVKASGYGETRVSFFDDICAFTGATLISSKTGQGMAEAKNFLGKCKKIVVSSGITTIIVGDKSLKLNEHIETLRSSITDVSLNEITLSQLKSRLASLTGGCAIIRVGGMTEMEMIERKYRIEDALNATQCAAKYGILQGGGMALVRAAQDLEKIVIDSPWKEDFLQGISIALKACSAPFEKIAFNAGLNGKQFLLQLSNDKRLGFDPAEGVSKDFFEEGILDPFKVTSTAFTNAASIASTFITLDCIVYEDVIVNK